MFFTGTFVQSNTHCCQLTSEWLKLAINFDDLYDKATFDIDAVDVFDVFQDGVGFGILEPCHGPKLDRSTD
jgi:hypothetical protein